MTNKTKLYGAYGSNLNLLQMSIRCPNAKKVGKTILNGYKLVFKGVADVIHTGDSDDFVELGLFEITESCEKALDIYEGFPHLYTKSYVPHFDFENNHSMIMIYVMNGHGIRPPCDGYLETIVVGYDDFKFDVDNLARSVKHSYQNEIL